MSAGRLILLVVLVYISIEITRSLSVVLGLPLDTTSFFVGMGVTLLDAFVVFQVTNWWSTVTRPTRRQAVVQFTSETPAQISRASVMAILRGGCLIAFLIMGVIVWWAVMR